MVGARVGHASTQARYSYANAGAGGFSCEGGDYGLAASVDAAHTAPAAVLRGSLEAR